jgi:hypothetical protein
MKRQFILIKYGQILCFNRYKCEPLTLWSDRFPKMNMVRFDTFQQADLRRETMKGARNIDIVPVRAKR